MISSVSNVSFRGEVANANAQDLINSPGKYTSAPAEAPADSFESSAAAEQEPKKSNTGKVLGGILAGLAVIYAGLSIAVGKGALKKSGGEGFMAKVQDFFHSVGESGVKLWNKVRGKAAEAADDAAKKGSDAAGDAAGAAGKAGDAAAEAGKAGEAAAEAGKAGEAAAETGKAGEAAAEATPKA